MKPVSLDEKRRERDPLCDYCGEAAHKTEYMCPRITKLRFSPDGVEIYFAPQTETIIVKLDADDSA